ncbi:MAG: glycine--tRNA ligase subunit beta [Betaproteobacteria bacterium 13_1_40CM_4_64_4]|nr:MAG: glycine--tRNA ligase subunit beta [Betaproteobacteria bacterium 13_1_40CM_4_64_4]
MTPATRTLVVELLTEELPPKALKGLGEAFAAGILADLRERGFLAPDSKATLYATPRRLAVSITQVRAVAPDAEVRRKLMPLSVACGPDGAASAAFRKKLASLGREDLIDSLRDARPGRGPLQITNDGNVEAVFLRDRVPGQALQLGLERALQDTIEGLPSPKVMSYASRGSYHNDVKFVRPAHGLLALHGKDVVAVRALGLSAGRTTAGHRFLARRDVEIDDADAYAPTLEAEGKVLPSFTGRRNRIVAGLQEAAGEGNLLMPAALLDEVTALVEWPKVYTGGFDPAFLEIPRECLILTMQQNQKYFAVTGADGRLQNRFLLVSNLDIRDPEAIIRGNERVLRARLADAKFFYDQDRKVSLESRVPKLAHIIYHNKLGSQGDRVTRLRELARRIATEIGADPVAADRAALLAKADLVTEMVGEFPELQGVMGRYYALHDGEPAAVADAIAQHYWPRFAGDAIPEGSVARAVALADKLEALAGLFGVGAQPTGDKDPFGLRRAAIGVLRILIDAPLAVDLRKLIDLAHETFSRVPAVRDATDAVEAFIHDRLRAYLREQGYTANQVEAVMWPPPMRVDLVPDRLAAVQSFVAMPEAEALAAANKRIVNILKKSGADAAPAVDRSLFADGAEHDLFAEVQKLLPVVHRHVDRGEYTEALRALASARTSVDRFFDDVLVMAEDPALRANRLALLRGLAEAMNQVADISKLAV